MLTLNPDVTELDRWVRNIIEVWNLASAEQLTRGLNWYQTAHELADVMSEGNVKAGAGVIAALSPMSAWAINVRMAEEAFENGYPAGHTGDALRKAAAIMAGADPEDVLPMSAKTGNFYRCILDPEDEEAVTVDRHAHDIVAGARWGNQDRGLSSKKRYAKIALAYRMAAAYLTERPSVVQATTWVVWTSMEG